MFPEECFIAYFYPHPRNEGRRLRNHQPQQEDEQQHRGDYDNSYNLEEEERGNMTGIVRATIDKYHPDPSTYPHIVETKRPRTLVEQRIEFWKHPERTLAFQKRIEFWQNRAVSHSISTTPGRR
jgi:hypothetical protein